MGLVMNQAFFSYPLVIIIMIINTVIMICAYKLHYITVIISSTLAFCYTTLFITLLIDRLLLLFAIICSRCPGGISGVKGKASRFWQKQKEKIKFYTIVYRKSIEFLLLLTTATNTAAKQRRVHCQCQTANVHKTQKYAV